MTKDNCQICNKDATFRVHGNTDTRPDGGLDVCDEHRRRRHVASGR